MSMLCIFAVFERQVNKCSPVATTSQPSTLRVAPRLSRAVTDIAIVTECQISPTHHELLDRNFRYELAEYTCVLNPNGRRGILAIIKKSITLVYITTINGDVLKLGINTS